MSPSPSPLTSSNSMRRVESGGPVQQDVQAPKVGCFLYAIFDLKTSNQYFTCTVNIISGITPSFN